MLLRFFSELVHARPSIHLLFFSFPLDLLKHAPLFGKPGGFMVSVSTYRFHSYMCLPHSSISRVFADIQVVEQCFTGIVYYNALLKYRLLTTFRYNFYNNPFQLIYCNCHHILDYTGVVCSNITCLFHFISIKQDSIM